MFRSSSQRPFFDGRPWCACGPAYSLGRSHDSIECETEDRGESSMHPGLWRESLFRHGYMEKLYCTSVSDQWKSRQVAQFIQENFMCRYGVPGEFISDNGSHFEKVRWYREQPLSNICVKEVVDLLKEYGITHHPSAPYRPQTNGALETASN